MYRDLLYLSEKTSKNLEKNERKNNLDKKKKIIFKEILCPKTGESISSTLCTECEYKDEFQRAHKSGVKMTTILCTFGYEKV